MKRKRLASKDYLIVVDKSFTLSKGGVILSYAFSIEVSEISNIIKLGSMLMDWVQKEDGKFLAKNFFSKTETPVIFAKDEELFIIWSFVAKDDDIVKELKKKKIKEVIYD